MKIYFKSFGCRTNQIEIESIVENLVSVGFVVSGNDWDVFLINSCSVTARAENEEISFIKKIASKNPDARIVITGCMASLFAERIKKISKNIEIFKNDEKEKIPSALSGRDIPTNYFSINGFYSKTRAFVKLQDGCNLKCSYCIVPFARSSISSKPFDTAVDEIKRLVDNGYKEIVLSGTRLGAYDSGGKKLNELLRMLSSLKGDFRVRLSSLEPMEINEELVDICSNSERFCNYFHIPLQSGSDKILSLMRRPYNRSFYSKRIELIRKRMKNPGLYSDIIVGFPSESDDDFNNSMDFISSLGLSGLHVFTYSKRPYTASESMAELDERIKKERSKKAHMLDKKLRDDYKKSLIGEVVISLSLKHKDGKTIFLGSNFVEIVVDEVFETNIICPVIINNLSDGILYGKRVI
jgi:threonylcarbamoyladenosine tRNA methylthiotransferase MtaB